MKQRMRINWGAAIALVYITFAAATVSFVVFAIGRPVELVSADYYEQSLKHDAHRQAIANADALGEAVRIAAAEDAPVIEIAMPVPVPKVSEVSHALDAAHEAEAAHVTDVEHPADVAYARAVTGTVTLYRPSDRNADRVVRLSLDDGGRQRIRVDGPSAHGRWTVKLAWRTGQREFYREQIVWLP
jgi:hypothetical protein